MTIPSVLQGAFEFAPLAYEHTIYCPAMALPISDIAITLFGSQSPRTGIGVNDVHVYINSVDITAGLVKALVANIQHEDSTAIRSAYAKGLRRWLRLETALGGAYPGGMTNDPNLAEALERQVDPSVLLTQLGNRIDPVAGWSGALHIFNYLFRDVPLQPAKLSQVLSQLDPPMDVGTLLPSGQPWSITLSSGPSISYSPVWIPEPAGGCVTYSIELTFDDSEEQGQLQQIDDYVQAIYGNLIKVTPSLILSLRDQLDQISAILDSADLQTGSISDIKAIAITLLDIQESLNVTP